MSERCERCGRFVGEDAMEGWTGGYFGDYNGKTYCAFGVGCNASEPPFTITLSAAPVPAASREAREPQ